jgi:ABC-2 type transport system ATP-binding protein
MPELVEVENLTKKFGHLVALSGLSLCISRGITFGLVGPNGSGKTTLIRILCGLLRPSSGKVSLFGRPAPFPEMRQLIGYMPQLESLYLDLTVEENLLFFASLYGLKGKERKQRISNILELVELEERYKSKVEHLSGGLRQRLSLACALLHSPELLLLDEPTVGVDPELRYSFWGYFSQLAENGSTILISTHYLDEANRCQRVLMLRAGRILAEGSPSEILSNTGEENLELAFLKLSQEARNVF